MMWAYAFSSLRETFPTRAPEWALAMILSLLTVIMISRPNFLADVPSFSLIVQIADQYTWIFLCMFAGGGRLVVLAINGMWRRTPHLRAAAAFIASQFWFLTTAGALQADGLPAGLAIYPVLFLLDAYNAVRCLGDAGLSDRLHKAGAQGCSHRTY